MTHLFDLAFGTTIFFLVALGLWLLTMRRSYFRMKRILEVTHRASIYRSDRARTRDAGRRLFAMVHWARGRLGLGSDTELPERLGNAGYRGTFPADVYNAARVLCPLLGLIVGAILPWHRSFWIIALPAAAYILPNIVLTRLVKLRREKIRRGIPDTIDLLVICVDAGLGIDQALLRVGQELGISHPQITQELLQINREQRAGKPRIQAWADMAARSELSDINAFASMLMQTERFGTPIARALSEFADNIRLKRRQLAEEMAAKTTIKIIFPLVFFIFPSIFIVLLGPVVITMMRSMSVVGQ
jgi:tight adherence protein C